MVVQDRLSEFNSGLDRVLLGPRIYLASHLAGVYSHLQNILPLTHQQRSGGLYLAAAMHAEHGAGTALLHDVTQCPPLAVPLRS